MFLQNVIEYIKHLSSQKKEAEYIELEIKILLDSRIKTPYFTNPYFKVSEFNECKAYLTNIFNTVHDMGTQKISQTINFIHTDKINNSMFVKQLCYKNGVQDSSLKNYYIKKSLICPIYITSDILPSYKLSINLETKENTDIGEFDIVRFRSRYSVIFNAGKLKNWQLDLTLVKECRNTDINSLKIIRDKMFDKNINVSNFITQTNWDYADRVECELEYVGDINDFKIDQIQDIETIFKSKTQTDLVCVFGEDDKFNKTYNDCICQIANILKPNMLDKFKQGKFGLKQLGSNPIELTKRYYQTDILPKIDEFIITEKIDGIRSMLLIYPTLKECYIINNKNKKGISSFELSDIKDVSGLVSSSDLELVILDTECVNNKYYVFDIIYIQSVDKNVNIHKLPFTKRSSYMNEIIKMYDFLYSKNFLELSSDDFPNQIRKFYNDMLELVKTQKEYEIDGLIIFSKNDNYNATIQCKWKPIMTIDFVAKQCPASMLGISPYVVKENQTLYLLFCGIKNTDYRKLGIVKFSNYDQIFKNICVNKYGKINDKYFPIQFAPSADPNAYLFWSDNENLDNKIVELSYDDGWKFIKIRTDRDNDMKRKTYYGNYFKYAEYIWMNYKDPLTLDILCKDFDSSRLSTYFQEDSIDHKATRKYNNFVKKILIDLNSKHIPLEYAIDLGSGKGQDLYKYIECGFKNVMMIDNDYDALMEIINRKYKYIEINKYNQSGFDKSLIYNNCKIFVHKADLSEPHKTVLDGIANSKLQTQSDVSMVVCNLALHYLIPNKSKIQNFCRLLNKLLSPGGIFIFTAFNGQKIFDLLKNASQWDKYDDNGKLIYSIKKKYRTNEFTGTSQKIDVLLPFSNGKYYTENLINISLLNSELEKKKIRLIADDSFDIYLSKFVNEKSYYSSQLTDNDKEYISLYHFYVYHKDTRK